MLMYLASSAAVKIYILEAEKTVFCRFFLQLSRNKYEFKRLVAAILSVAENYRCETGSRHVGKHILKAILARDSPVRLPCRAFLKSGGSSVNEV